MATKAWIEANRDKARSYKKKFYASNSEKVKAESVAFRNEMRSMVDAIKAESGCGFCREIDPCCLDFHHHDVAGKEFSIAAAITRGLSRSVVFAEIRKCVVVCSNCHGKLHAGKLNLAGVVQWQGLSLPN